VFTQTVPASSRSDITIVTRFETAAPDRLRERRSSGYCDSHDECCSEFHPSYTSYS
jgi:hypothetical protein